MGGYRIDTGLVAPEKSRNPLSHRPSVQSRWRKQFPHGLQDVRKKIKCLKGGVVLSPTQALEGLRRLPTLDVALKVLGIALVAIGVGFPIWRVTVEKGKANQTRHAPVFAVGFLAVFAGLALILADRVTVLTVRGVGTIQAVTQQAIIDAQAVTAIRAEVEKVKTRIDNSRDTIDLVASEARKAKELSEITNAQSNDAEKTLERLNSTITTANNALRQLQGEAEFQAIILAAQNDDRPSFDKLKQIADDNNSKFANFAGHAWATIFESHCNLIISGAGTVPWAPGIDPSKLSMPDLSAVYKSTPSTLKPAVLSGHKPDSRRIRWSVFYRWNRSEN